MSFLNMHMCTHRSCWLLALLLLFVLLVLPGPAKAQEDSLIIPQADTVQGNIATVSRDILVEGEVLGDVTSWSGTITIKGHVSGDVVNYSGPVILAEQARVDGSVLVMMSGAHQPQREQIAGQLITLPAASNTLLSAIGPAGAAQPHVAGWLGAVSRSVAFTLCAFVMAMGSLLLWPRRIEQTSRTLAYIPWRSLSVGLLTTCLLTALLIVISALLMVTLIGMPLILLLVLLVQIPYSYGLVTLAHTVARRLMQRKPASMPLLATSLLVLALLLPSMLIGIGAPLWSVLLFYSLASPGLGAAVLSRAGALVPLVQA